MSQEENIHYFTNIAPHYRQRLWEMMAEDQDLEIIFYFGKSNIGIKEMNFQSVVWLSRRNILKRIKNLRLFNRVVWQQGVISKVFFGNVKKALFLGDANIVSTWIAALILHLWGSKVYFWQHGFSGDEFFLKRYVKILFNKLADHHFVYGKFAQKTMINYGFKPDKIHLIYNSLDYDKHKELREEVIDDDAIKKIFENPNLPLLIFIGRLTRVKKLDLLLHAVNKLNSERILYNLLIIGDGAEKEYLTKLAMDLLDDGTYHFYGACYNENEIGRLLANADLCVSPGNVGLTAIHSLSFGTPVCTHSNLNNQMPEIEAIIQDKTGVFFRENDLDDLVLHVRKWFNKDKSRKEIRKKCYQIIDDKYNPYYQLNVFRKVLLGSD